MAISGLTTGSFRHAWVADSLTQIHDALNEKSQQLATGKIGQTYAALGHNVARNVDLRSKLSQIDVYNVEMAVGNASLSVASETVTTLTKQASTISSGPLSTLQSSNSDGRAAAQTNLRSSLGTMLGYMNTQDDGSYIFGGRNLGAAPALDVSTIIDGDIVTGKAGLGAYISERQTADLGSNGLGRLTLSLPPSGTTVSLSEEAANLPFGMTIKSISSTLSNVTSSLSGTSPKSLDVAFTGVPATNGTLTVTLNLPDGTTTDLTMMAGAAAGTNQFAIGADAATTAANFQTAIATSLQTVASTALSGASALKAAKDFFAGSLTAPPQRVLIPNPGSAATATGFITDATQNAAKTVVWYQGTDAAAGGDPRLDRVVQISPTTTVGLGIRGNEASFSGMLASVAVAAATNFSSTDPVLAQNQFNDLAQRAKRGVTQGTVDLQTVLVSLSSSQTQIKSAQEQHNATKTVLNSVISSIEDASPEQTAAELSSLQTQIQIAYQVTAKLLKLSLADYL